MKRFSLGVLAFVSCWHGFALVARADIMIAANTVDLGEVRGGVAAVAMFTIVNTGTAPIELVDLERSCGCIDPRWEKRLLKPSERSVLQVRVRTLGQAEGPRVWPMTLVIRDGDVVRKHALQVKATMRNDIVLQPAQLALHVTKAVEQVITLVDRRETPLRVVSVTTTAPGVMLDIVERSAGTTRLRLTVDAAKLPPGRGEHVLRLATNDPLYDTLEVPLTLVRIEKPNVTVSPETLEIILAAGQMKANTLVRLRSATGSALVIRKVDVSETGIACTWAEADDGAFVKIQVDRTTYRGTALQAAIRVVLENETLAIPILIRLE